MYKSIVSTMCGAINLNLKSAFAIKNFIHHPQIKSQGSPMLCRSGAGVVVTGRMSWKYFLAQQQRCHRLAPTTGHGAKRKQRFCHFVTVLVIIVKLLVT